MKELKEQVKKNLAQQVELLNQTNAPAECNMICAKIHALAAVLLVFKTDISAESMAAKLYALSTNNSDNKS